MTASDSFNRSPVTALLLAIGIVLGGWLAGNGFARARSGDRFVTVKGISERDVSADLAIWPLRVVASDADLASAHTRMETSVREIFKFLAKHGIDTTTAQLQDFTVTDAFAQEYAGPQRASNRFVVKQTVVVRSDKPLVIQAASQAVGELVAAGVVLSSGAEFGAGGPTFIFRGLNDLKPKMIAEATARAREGAVQFANDSHTSLGGIREASQGVFEILPRDQAPGITEASQVMKTLRVVTTVEYLLR